VLLFPDRILRVTSECRVLRAEATIATITICRQTAPTLALEGNVQQSYETSLLQLRTFNASLIGQLTVPIYQGGAEMPSLVHASPHNHGFK
jgi:hypothetical protein